jgi:hypothetical protein
LISFNRYYFAKLNNFLNGYIIHIAAVAGRRTRRETDRLCSDNEAGGRHGKAER